VSAEYEVRLDPVRGDGLLTEWDVDLAVVDVPRGAEVVVFVDEADHFDPGVPWRLARLLCGSVVRLRFGRRAHRLGPDFEALYERAAAEYLAVEARMLGA